jgi:hypothetical protein
MNRSDFLKMIGNSGPADRQMIGEVNELINIFPYFQSAYMLLLKGLQNTADVKFENQLRVSAMRIADREVLYYFLKKETKTEVKPEITAVVVAVPDENDSTESHQTVIESAKNSEDLINEIERSIVDEKTEEKNIDHSVMISTDAGFDESDAAVLIIDEETGTVEEKITYMDPGFAVPEQTDLLELEPDESKVNESPGNNLSDDKQVLKGTPSVKELQSDLIEKFIIANPRIEPAREKSDKPVEDISRPFVEEGGGFVTETLARIYIKQGYFSKAIDIYEKLSLKFPEKSSYFATQIEKVRGFIKK